MVIFFFVGVVRRDGDDIFNLFDFFFWIDKRFEDWVYFRFKGFGFIFYCELGFDV